MVPVIFGILFGLVINGFYYFGRWTMKTDIQNLARNTVQDDPNNQYAGEAGGEPGYGTWPSVIGTPKPPEPVRRHQSR